MVQVLAGFALLAGWLAAQGLVLVEASEVAVVLTWGRVTPPALGPGLHLLWPPPIQHAVKVRPREVRKLSLSWSEALADSPRPPSPGELRPLSRQGRGERVANYIKRRERFRHRPLPYVLTGDENLVTIQAALQYRISSPGHWLFAAEERESMLKSLAQSATLLEVAGRSVESLTRERAEIGVAIRSRVQRRAHSLSLGVDILSVNLLSVDPPQAAVHAFKAVSNARADSSKQVSEARARANQLLASTGGESARITIEAKAYHKERLAVATGEAGRFLGMVKEHARAPEDLRLRLALEVKEKVWARTRQVLLPRGAKPKIRIMTPGR